MVSFTIESSAFKHGEFIPSKFTCQGLDRNPEFIIRNVPEETKSLVLIIDDPDAPAGIWVHWVMWNINPQTIKIPENGKPPEVIEGLNSWDFNGYGGPCPPFGVHRYFIKLYAIDIMLSLDKTSRKKDVMKAIQDHILAETQLLGLYEKK